MYVMPDPSNPYGVGTNLSCGSSGCSSVTFALFPSDDIDLELQPQLAVATAGNATFANDGGPFWALINDPYIRYSIEPFYWPVAICGQDTYPL